MKPPICRICDKDFDPGEEGNLVRFKKGESGKEWDKNVRDRGGTGHPPYVDWFCGEHIEAAEKFSHLQKGEAMNKIRKEIETNPGT